MELREVTGGGAVDALVADHAYGHHCNAGLGEVKGARRRHIVSPSSRRDVPVPRAQVLTRLVPGMPVTMLYTPRGPVAAPHDTVALHALASGLRRHANRDGRHLLQGDPAWPCGGAAAPLAKRDYSPQALAGPVTRPTHWT